MVYHDVVFLFDLGVAPIYRVVENVSSRLLDKIIVELGLADEEVKLPAVKRRIRQTSENVGFLCGRRLGLHICGCGYGLGCTLARSRGHQRGQK